MPSSTVDVYEDGDYRNVTASKKNNTLLFRNPLGRARKSAYKLPKSDFVYGKTEYGDDEGAREVIQSWQNASLQAQAAPGRDFVRLNKNAAVSGATTAKKFTDYRKSNDVRMRVKHIPTGRTKYSAPAGIANSGHTFGIKSKKSEGIGGLITNAFQRKWILDQRQRTHKVQKKKKEANQSFHTKASRGHHKKSAKTIAKEEAKAKAKRDKKFAHVKSSISTTRPASSSKPATPVVAFTEEPVAVAVAN